MTAPNETVLRPNGQAWRYSSSSGRNVRVVHTSAGTEIVVTRTHDLEKAAVMASVRWPAFHPGIELPVGERGWRRINFGRPNGGRGPSNFDTRPGLDVSDGRESRSFPVVVFRLPTVAEEAA